MDLLMTGFDGGSGHSYAVNFVEEVKHLLSMSCKAYHIWKGRLALGRIGPIDSSQHTGKCKVSGKRSSKSCSGNSKSRISPLLLMSIAVRHPTLGPQSNHTTVMARGDSAASRGTVARGEVESVQ
ncbi:Hypothetical predicted protein [Cloeon dipterum]|uniref:Uncharacterized protein n=1 Tax=Cloeon dipterum TaxID=197152 RepID=A0A8S1C9S6_9INSE|nr:Hypothetical predicted protein [Cloeon dipterum]